MASGLLFMAVTIFAFRGFFLGFTGVIGKALGIIAGYIVALGYRSKAADWVAQNTTLELPAMVIEVGCGAALFLSTMFTTGLLVSALAKVLKKSIPVLEPVLNDKSTAGRICGATTNGLIGAGIILTGIWIYGMMGKGSVEPPYLQHAANTFGNSLFESIINNKNFSISSKTGGFTLPTLSLPKSESKPEIISSSKGSAVIVSENNPSKVLSIENIREEVSTLPDTEQRSNFMKLLNDSRVQEMISNPDIQQFALEQLKNNPEKIEDMIGNTGVDPSQLQELLQKLEQ